MPEPHDAPDLPEGSTPPLAPFLPLSSSPSRKPNPPFASGYITPPMSAPPSPPPPAEERAGSLWRPQTRLWLLWMITAILVVSAVLVTIYAMNRPGTAGADPGDKHSGANDESSSAEGSSSESTSDESFPSGETPPSGDYDVVSVGSGQCLGVGPEIGNPGTKQVIVQDTCGDTKLKTSLVDKAGGFIIAMDDPDHGHGCVTAEHNHRDYLFVPLDCHDDTHQVFTLEKADGGYRLHIKAADDLCLGVIVDDHGSKKPGLQTLVYPCGKEGGQIFRFAKP